MTDTQKTMTAYPETRTVTWVDDQTGQKAGECEYVRLDLAQAMVAAAYENAAPHRKNPVDVSGCSKQTYFDAMPSIEAYVDARPHMDAMLTPAEARATLDAMLAKARKDAFDSVLKEVEGYLPEFGAGEPQDGTDRTIDQCWRDFRKVVKALIDRTAGDKQ